MDCERRRFFGMKRAEPLECAAGALETHIIRNYFDDVGRIANCVGKVLHQRLPESKKTKSDKVYGFNEKYQYRILGSKQVRTVSLSASQS